VAVAPLSATPKELFAAPTSRLVPSASSSTKTKTRRTRESSFRDKYPLSALLRVGVDVAGVAERWTLRVSSRSC
jgi:hypothetical protein